MIADAETWTKLLSTIGIQLVKDYQLANDLIVYHLQSIDNKTTIGVRRENVHHAYTSGWYSIKDMENEICRQCISFVSLTIDYGKHFIDNPWFGATSLDELKIRSDLYASNG